MHFQWSFVCLCEPDCTWHISSCNSYYHQVIIIFSLFPTVQLGSTFTVRNPARVQNKTQITIRNPPQQESTSSLSLATSHHGTSPRQSNNPLLAGSSTLRVTKAVPQPQKVGQMGASPICSFPRPRICVQKLPFPFMIMTYFLGLKFKRFWTERQNAECSS